MLACGHMIMCHILAASCTDGKHIISPFLRLLIQKVAHQSVSLVVTDPDVKKKGKLLHPFRHSIHPSTGPSTQTDRFEKQPDATCASSARPRTNKNQQRCRNNLSCVASCLRTVLHSVLRAFWLVVQSVVKNSVVLYTRLRRLSYSLFVYTGVFTNAARSAPRARPRWPRRFRLRDAETSRARTTRIANGPASDHQRRTLDQTDAKRRSSFLLTKRRQARYAMISSRPEKTHLTVVSARRRKTGRRTSAQNWPMHMAESELKDRGSMRARAPPCTPLT